MEIVLWIALGLTFLLVSSVVVMYNRFVRQRTLVEESWGQIDVELTRRHELIPNLVETVKGYAAHERAVLDALVQARELAAAHRSDTPHARESFENQVTDTVRQVMVRAEDYPDLKASSNFLQLQDELTTTENRIAAARRFYNGNVRALNTRVRTFPSNLVAGAFNFEVVQFFELRDPVVATVPHV